MPRLNNSINHGHRIQRAVSKNERPQVSSKNHVADTHCQSNEANRDGPFGQIVRVSKSKYHGLKNDRQHGGEEAAFEHSFNPVHQEASVQHLLKTGFEPNQWNNRKEQEPVVFQISKLVDSARIGGVWCKSRLKVVFQYLKDNDGSYRQPEN